MSYLGLDRSPRLICLPAIRHYASLYNKIIVKKRTHIEKRNRYFEFFQFSRSFNSAGLLRIWYISFNYFLILAIRYFDSFISLSIWIFCLDEAFFSNWMLLSWFYLFEEILDTCRLDYFFANDRFVFIKPGFLMHYWIVDDYVSKLMRLFTLRIFCLALWTW